MISVYVLSWYHYTKLSEKVNLEIKSQYQNLILVDEVLARVYTR